MKRYPLVLVAVWAMVVAQFAMPVASWGQDALDAAFKEVAAYKFGASRESLTVVSDAVRDSYSNPEQRKALVGKLVALLGSDATLEGKDFACRQLSLAGGDESVAALAGLLTADDTTNMARYALERIPGAAADKALLDALGKTSGVARVGVINSLGVRRMESAVTALAPLAKDADAGVAEAAWAALGKIGTDNAAAALLSAKKPVGDAQHGAWADAYMRAADQAAGRDAAKAAPMYDALLGADEPAAVRVAAFVGKASALGAGALPAVVEAMKGGDPAMQRAAAIFVRKIEGAEATAAFAGLIGALDAGGQILLLAALGDRGDAGALPAAAEAANSGDVAVRTAAISAMARLGNATVIPALLKAAVSSEKAEQEAARLSLDTLKGADIDAAMADALKSVDDAQKAELARSLAARGATSAVPALLATAGAGAEDVRKEAFKALAELGGAGDVAALVDLLVKAEGDGARREAEKAVSAVSKRMADGKVAALLAALGTTKDAKAVGSLYTVLSMVGDDAGLEPLRAAAKTGKSEEKDAAVRALTSWPTASALGDTLDIMKSTKDDTHRVLALRGMLRMLESQKDRPAADSLNYLTAALKAVKGADEKKMVIGGLANVYDTGAMKLVQTFLADEALKQEAALAVQSIFRGMCVPSASVNSESAYMVFDADKETRWSTGAPQKGGEWFALNMNATYEVSKITLDCAQVEPDFPRGYQVFVSKDGQDWGAPVAEGEGTKGVTEIALKPATGQHVKIVQTGSSPDRNWTLCDVKVEFK